LENGQGEEFKPGRMARWDSRQPNGKASAAMEIILLFRVLQESLTNIHRHSGSSRAEIRAGIHDETVSLEVRDYGRGISQEVLETFKTSGSGVGVGLTGIHERLREVGGKLDISSSSEGTILRVSLPVTNIREAHRNFAASGR
jgi:two-component system, NarL family, sensor kinase